LEYSRWAPVYDAIRREFAFSWDREEAAAARLRGALPAAALARPQARLDGRLRGRDVVVVGLAPGAGPPPLWRQPFSAAAVAVVAADGAAATCLEAGIVPDVIATDLDGPVPSEITANRRGALVVVHAHGDNLALLEEWVPQFPGELAGSWAGAPGEGLLDAGGFTDGDRGAYLAEASGATRVLLWGFEFARADEPDPGRHRQKLAKLAWAARALAALAEDRPGLLWHWHRDGTVTPYASAGSSEASTR
jgi:uncharacterized Rossmann fold enzyme